MAGQGSTGNVIAAVCSFFIPGLGQLVQGRVLMALVHFVLAGVLWIIFMGWIIHLWSIIRRRTLEAALRPVVGYNAVHDPTNHVAGDRVDLLNRHGADKARR